MLGVEVGVKYDTQGKITMEDTTVILIVDGLFF
jgi:hypothetical protein